MYLNNLGGSLRDRYSQTGAMEDLEEAIQIMQNIITTTLADHSYYAIYLSDLGNCLRDWYFRTGAMEDLNEAIRCMQQASNLPSEYYLDQARCIENLGS